MKILTLIYKDSTTETIKLQDVYVYAFKQTLMSNKFAGGWSYFDGKKERIINLTMIKEVIIS